MTTKYKAALRINKQDITMNPFVEAFVASTTAGAVSALKGVDYVKKIEIKVELGEVTVKVNSDNVQLTPFPNDIIANTLAGMVKTLKGGDEVKTIEINVEV